MSLGDLSKVHHQHIKYKPIEWHTITPLTHDLQISSLKIVELGLILHELKHSGKHLPCIKDRVAWVDLLDFIQVHI